MKEPTQPPVDPEKAVREAAIDRFIRGEKPTAICRAVQRSRAWFYRILARYRRGGRAALSSRSRAPHRVHNRTVAETTAAIVRLRQTIAARSRCRVALCGAGRRCVGGRVEPVPACYRPAGRRSTGSCATMV